MAKGEKLILKVRENKKSKQKRVTIPQECEDIQGDDYVEVIKH